MQILLIRPGPD